ncbi:TrkA, K transport system, NAD-binding component [Halorhabdus sp. SVX81]|uniref:hypothetical protein n=1 Tax=Halorhabdus sp. SVX81 TaxID=2978283 RepID=UPI0023DCD6C6|nr:hypothetical protein [Halorhabdus sp. SVX81]WEL17700.1 TrkA, K transport system, NAD-binding component [Halorhabdus sp. SVX81]
MTVALLPVIGGLPGEPAQLSALVSPTVRSAAISLVGFAVLAVLTAGIGAVAYRRLTSRPIPLGTAILLGWVSVATWLTARIAAGSAIVSDLSIVLDATGYFLLAAFGLSGAVSVGGRRLGDAIAGEVTESPPDEQSEQTAKRRRSAKQATSVELPDRIRTRSGSEPVEEDLKRELEGDTWLFPSGLPPAALESRCRERLERDYGIDRVGIELSEDGDIRQLAIGYEPSGLSVTLPPRTVGVAIRNAMVPDAAPGDPVELWTADEERVEFAGSATLHSTPTDTATLVLPEQAARTLGDIDGYSLTTKPAVPDDVTEFLSVLRACDHSITMLSISSGEPLEGEFVGWVAVDVLAIVRDSTVLPFPDETETLRSGDDIYVFGGPAAFESLGTFERERRSELRD